MKRVVALIPAKRKSERIKNKNLKKIGKRPLLWWTLDSAKKSKYIDEIYVSSDSSKILNYSKKHKAETIKRPKNISNHLATKKDVIYHALNYLKKKDNFFDFLIYLQPTSPLRTSYHIDYALNKIFKKKISGLVSVSKQSDDTLWKIKVKNNIILNDTGKNKNFAKRSQDLKKIYRPNGAIFIFNLKKLKYKNQFDISKGFQIYEMDRLSSIDIDEYYDFNLADLILKKRKRKN
jgi:CMP-N,N'-diacetyllegionaminic acid synthase